MSLATPSTITSPLKLKVACSYSSNIDVEIIANPIPNLSVDDNEICIGESIQFSASAGYADYNWSNNALNQNTFAYTPSSLADNQFSVTVTGDALCTTTSTVSITIHDLPLVDITREQVNRFITSIWNNMKMGISKAKNISSNYLVLWTF